MARGCATVVGYMHMSLEITLVETLAAVSNLIQVLAELVRTHEEVGPGFEVLVVSATSSRRQLSSS